MMFSLALGNQSDIKATIAAVSFTDYKVTNIVLC